MTHSWPIDVTTRTYPAKTYGVEDYATPGCPSRASTSSPDVAKLSEPESTRTLTSAAAEAHGTRRHPAKGCLSGSKRSSVSKRHRRLYQITRDGENLDTSESAALESPLTAGTWVPAAELERSDDVDSFCGPGPRETWWSASSW